MSMPIGAVASLFAPMFAFAAGIALMADVLLVHGRRDWLGSALVAVLVLWPIAGWAILAATAARDAAVRGCRRPGARRHSWWPMSSSCALPARRRGCRWRLCTGWRSDDPIGRVIATPPLSGGCPAAGREPGVPAQDRRLPCPSPHRCSGAPRGARSSACPPDLQEPCRRPPRDSARFDADGSRCRGRCGCGCRERRAEITGGCRA